MPRHNLDIDFYKYSLLLLNNYYDNYVINAIIF